MAYWANLGKETITRWDLPFLEDLEPGLPAVPDASRMDFEKFLDALSRPLAEIIRMLETLEKAEERNERVGRRLLYEMLKKEGYHISEHDVRHALIQMQHYGYVSILKGRGGTVITPLGIGALDYFRQC